MQNFLDLVNQDNNHMFSNCGIWGMGMGSEFIGLIFMLIFWILVVVGIIYLIKYLVSKDKKTGYKTALEILEERYARGEINKQEFESRKQDLLSKE